MFVTCKWAGDVTHVFYETRQVLIMVQTGRRDLGYNTGSFRSHTLGGASVA